MHRFLLLILVVASTTAFADERMRSTPNKVANRLLCKTGPEKRNSPLKLYFHYNLPFQFEPEDPTMPLGRQVVVLAGKPVVQLFFEKAPLAAGENGENLQPMQCAFARRALREREPSQVQILLAGNQTNWISQAVGQRVGAITGEYAILTPTGDWTFAYQFERVFSIEIDEMKTFVTTQLPKPLN